MDQKYFPRKSDSLLRNCNKIPKIRSKLPEITQKVEISPKFTRLLQFLEFPGSRSAPLPVSYHTLPAPGGVVNPLRPTTIVANASESVPESLPTRLPGCGR